MACEIKKINCICLLWLAIVSFSWCFINVAFCRHFLLTKSIQTMHLVLLSSNSPPQVLPILSTSLLCEHFKLLWNIKIKLFDIVLFQWAIKHILKCLEFDQTPFRRISDSLFYLFYSLYLSFCLCHIWFQCGISQYARLRYECSWFQYRNTL